MGASPSLHAGQEEDLIDRWFNRPLASPVATVLARCGLHPNLVSLVGMSVGVAAGFWFREPGFWLAMPGVLLLLLSTILDNADGMVARRTGKTSELGYVLDGLCDNVVFFSVYINGIIGVWHQASPLGGAYGATAVVLGVLAGISHSFQSAALDFYKMEWRLWASLSPSAAFAPRALLRTRAQLERGWSRFFLRLRSVQAGQQELLAADRLGRRPAWEKAQTRLGAVEFSNRYAAANRLPLSGWFFMGPNWHVVAICGCALMGRLDLYFWSQLLLFNGVFWATRRLQRVRDAHLG